MLQIVERFYKFCKEVFWEYDESSCLTRAAAMSYATLLSIVPLMAVALSILAAFPVYQEIGKKMQDIIFANFVAGSADVVQQHLQTFANQAAKLSATGLFILLVTAVLMVFNMESAFNAIWRVKERRHGVTAFLIYWAVLTLLPILIAVGFAISTYLMSLPYIQSTTASIKLPFAIAFPYLLTWAAFSFLYLTLPNRKVRLRHALPGAFVAMVFFEFAKYAFTLYILYFPTYELVYGALAGVPIFLFWVYLSWLIILFGAVISHVLGRDLNS